MRLEEFAAAGTGHTGGTVGYQANLAMFTGTGNGAASMSNSGIHFSVGHMLLKAIATA